MTDEGMERLDLDPIRKRCEAATPGPWYQGKPEDAPTPDATELSKLLCFFSDEGGPRFYDWMHDGDFVAHARTDVPALLARVEKLEWDLEAAETEVERLRAQPSHQQQPGWLPIESAPTDRAIMMYDVAFGVYDIGRLWSPETMPQPTHWMPLPAAPTDRRVTEETK